MAAESALFGNGIPRAHDNHDDNGCSVRRGGVICSNPENSAFPFSRRILGRNTSLPAAFARHCWSVPPQTLQVGIKRFCCCFTAVSSPLFFEELIFRGYLWNRLDAVLSKESFVFIWSVVLFTVWHICHFFKNYT